MTKGSPEKVALKSFDLLEYPLGCIQDREKVEGHGLKDSFDKNKSTGKVERAKRPRGESGFKFVKQLLPG